MPQLAVEMTGDEAKLFKAMQKLVAKQGDMEKAFKRIKEAGRDAGKETEKSFTGKSLSSIKGYIVQFGSLATAIGVASAALRSFKENQDRAFQSATALTEANRSLVQISKDQAQLEARMKRADTAAARFGVDPAIARQVLFSSLSENWSDNYENVMATRGAMDPLAAASTAGQVPGLFNGKINAMQALNGVLQAGAASRARTEEIAMALPTAAEGTAKAGMSPEETMGALSVLASRFGSPNQAATSISTFADKASRAPFLQGQGLVQASDTLAGMSEEDRRKFLGDSKELDTAYKFLQMDRATIQRRTMEVRAEMALAGTDDSLLASKQRMTAGGTMGSLNRLQQAKVAEDIANRENRIGRTVDQRISRTQALAQLEDEGVSPIKRFQAEAFGGAAEAVGASAELQYTATKLGGAGNLATANSVIGLPFFAMDVFESMNTELKAIRAANERQANRPLTDPNRDQ
jgi:hypothetical protein